VGRLAQREQPCRSGDGSEQRLRDIRLMASKATLRAELTGVYHEERRFCLRLAHAQVGTEIAAQLQTPAKPRSRASASHRHHPARRPPLELRPSPITLGAGSSLVLVTGDVRLLISA
jgi:hypothetical protein